jgi:hypothetical protein
MLDFAPLPIRLAPQSDLRCIVRTTLEVLAGLLPDWSFARELDAAAGYAELAVRKRGAPS